MRDSNGGDSSGPSENLVQSEPEKKRGIIEKVKHLTSLGKKNNAKLDELEQTSPYDSDRSPVFDSDDSYDSTTSSGSSSNSGGIHNPRSTLSNGSERFTTSDTAKTRLSHLPRNISLNGWNYKTPTNEQRTQTSYPGPITVSYIVFFFYRQNIMLVSVTSSFMLPLQKKFVD